MSRPEPVLGIEEHLESMQRSAQKGDLERALLGVLLARQKYGEREVLWNRQGIYLSDLARYREALISFDSGLLLDARSVRLWNNKGRTLRALGRHADALRCYERAIEIDPGPTIPWDNKGNCLLAMKRIEEARRCFAHVLQSEPANHNVRRKLAQHDSG